MAETLTIDPGSKTEKYKTLLPQIENIISGEPDLIANLANVAAAIYETFTPLWVGFYLVKPSLGPAGRHGPVQLVLGPFQGPLACTRIDKGRGVCGTAWQTGQTQVVPDVEQFPGHIACSSRSRSEIVVPLRDANGRIWGVLDIDSEALGAFDPTDAYYLTKLCEALPHMGTAAPRPSAPPRR